MIVLSKKILIVSQSHLCRNPRVLKEAFALISEGYAVTILTAIYSDKLLDEDMDLIRDTTIEYECYSDLRKTNIASVTDRLIRALAVKMNALFNVESMLSLGYGAIRIKKKIINYDACLIIMHQELPTIIGTKLIKQGYKVTFDIEDWYSEDLLPQARKQRPLRLLRAAESFALNNSLYCATTSYALAKKLSEDYKSAIPEVIYNVFPFRQKLIESQKDFLYPLKLFWFSQTIGRGRGIEQFIKIIHALKTPFELHLLGNINRGYLEELTQLMPIQHQLYFHEPVDESILAEKIADFDIGLALELDTPMSRNYTITNKFFQYLQSGLPIILRETEGQNEAFERFEQGFKLSQLPSAEEIIELDKWLGNPEELMAARKKAVAAARFYNWENESKKIIQLVKGAL